MATTFQDFLESRVEFDSLADAPGLFEFDGSYAQPGYLYLGHYWIARNTFTDSTPDYWTILEDSALESPMLARLEARLWIEFVAEESNDVR